jgi:hypothetical protein
MSLEVLAFLSRGHQVWIVVSRAYLLSRVYSKIAASIVTPSHRHCEAVKL